MNNKNTHKTKLDYTNLFDWCFNDDYILNSEYVFFGRNPYFQKRYEEDNDEEELLLPWRKF